MHPLRSYTVFVMYSQSSPAAKKEMKLHLHIHLARRHPNGLRGNIRLVNFAARSPAATIYGGFRRHKAAGTPDCFAAAMCPSTSHARQVRMTFIAPIKPL